MRAEGGEGGGRRGEGGRENWGQGRGGGAGGAGAGGRTWPGPRRPFSTMLASGMSTTPVSLIMHTSPSSVRKKRAGRRPLRSSCAPSCLPSQKVRSAGPSHACDGGVRGVGGGRGRGNGRRGAAGGARTGGGGPEFAPPGGPHSTRACRRSRGTGRTPAGCGTPRARGRRSRAPASCRSGSGSRRRRRGSPSRSARASREGRGGRADEG